MQPATTADLPALFRRLERRNRFLTVALGLMTALFFIAASPALNNSEVRAHRMVLLDENGKPEYYMQGLRNGYDINGDVHHVTKLF